MPQPKEAPIELNWVDPDVLAYYGGALPADTDQGLEKDFKDFFEHGWSDPKHDDLRERWDPLIHDADPYGRLYGKMALWSLVQLLDLRERAGKKAETTSTKE